MAKQTELGSFLKSLHRAIYAHVDLGRTPHVAVTDVRLKHTEEEVDKATKRLFSYFDKMQEQIDVGLRDVVALRGQLTYFQSISKRHEECVQAATKIGVTFRQETSPGGAISWYVAELPGSASTVKDVPFDSTRANAGHPIEVLVAADTWHERKYRGVMLGPDSKTYVVHDAYKDGSDFSRLDHVRMKAPSELTFYANVYKIGGPSGIIGSLYDTADNAKRYSHSPLTVQAFPVKVTVTL